jgi:hypothetical protein
MWTSFEELIRQSKIPKVPTDRLAMTTFYKELDFRVSQTGMFITIMSTGQK